MQASGNTACKWSHVSTALSGDSDCLACPFVLSERWWPIALCCGLVSSVCSCDQDAAFKLAILKPTGFLACFIAERLYRIFGFSDLAANTVRDLSVHTQSPFLTLLTIAWAFAGSEGKYGPSSEPVGAHARDGLALGRATSCPSSTFPYPGRRKRLPMPCH